MQYRTIETARAYTIGLTAFFGITCLLWISDPVRPRFSAISSKLLAGLNPDFHTAYFSSGADLYQYTLLTKYQNLGQLSLTRNSKQLHCLLRGYRRGLS